MIPLPGSQRAQVLRLSLHPWQALLLSHRPPPLKPFQNPYRGSFLPGDDGGAHLKHAGT